MVSPLLPSCISRLSRVSHTINSFARPRSTSYSHCACVPSSKVTCNRPSNPARHCRTASAFVGSVLSMITFPKLSLTFTTNVELCASIPIYLSNSMGRSSFWVAPVVLFRLQARRGAPFYNAWLHSFAAPRLSAVGLIFQYVNTLSAARAGWSLTSQVDSELATPALRAHTDPQPKTQE